MSNLCCMVSNISVIFVRWIHLITVWSLESNDFSRSNTAIDQGRCCLFMICILLIMENILRVVEWYLIVCFWFLRHKIQSFNAHFMISTEYNLCALASSMFDRNVETYFSFRWSESFCETTAMIRAVAIIPRRPIIAAVTWNRNKVVHEENEKHFVRDQTSSCTRRGIYVSIAFNEVSVFSFCEVQIICCRKTHRQLQM